MAALVIISLVTSTTFADIHKYVAGNQYNNWEDAKNHCESGSQLATIFTVTDNHDARNVCNNNNGCWINVRGSSCVASDYARDVYQYFYPAGYGTPIVPSVLNYGFESFTIPPNAIIATTPANSPQQNAWIALDGPWHPEGFTPVDGHSCVYIDPTDTPSNSEYNAIWKIGACAGSTMRTALCNRPVPPILLLYYEMVTEEGSGDWVQMPSSSPSIFELPLSTNANRCKYANNPADISEKWAGSKVLQGCWAIRTTSDNTAKNSLATFRPTTNFTDCQVQINMDPWSSQDGGACLLEYTIDGTNWIEIQRFSSDDAATFYFDLPETTNNNEDFGVRIALDERIDNDAECYFNYFWLRCFEYVI